MSQKLIDHSPDLKRLRDEGYALKINPGFLVLEQIPYVNNNKEIKYGTLVMGLNQAGNKAAKPPDHTAWFAGEHPCDHIGKPITQIVNNSQNQVVGGIAINYYFSCCPTEPYKDYYEKVKTYETALSGPAQHLESNVTARVYPVMLPEEEDGSVFNYYDTASSRAGISEVSDKLAVNRVAIIGVGGTGSYVLDLLAKTPVKEIHIFDGDKFLNHNAFRSPGAPAVEDLEKQMTKVDYFASQYSQMHRHIIPHPDFITLENVALLQGMDFVFLCMDRGLDKRGIVDKLVEWGMAFIDVGMSLYLVDNQLLGMLRVTASTNDKRDHIKKKIPFVNGNENDDYAQNIQVADLNALNAALAVHKWKKLCGFYQDLERENHTTYDINVNQLNSQDQL